MLSQIGRHVRTVRGGQNLSARFTRMPHLSKTSAPLMDAGISNLSDQGLANESTAAAASRIVRDGKEYTLFYGIKVPKKPTPPAADG